MRRINVLKPSRIRYVLTVFLACLLAAGVLASCAHHESSVRKETKSDGTQTTVIERETVYENNDGGGVVGNVFHVVGEILAFPFRVAADLFRFIF